MKAEQEHQQKQSQQTQPEPGETSGEGLSTSILKVKSQKGKIVEIVQVKEDKLVEGKTDKERRRNQRKEMNQLNKKRLKTKVIHHLLSLKIRCMNLCRKQK